MHGVTVFCFCEIKEIKILISYSILKSILNYEHSLCSVLKRNVSLSLQLV